jgi:hypothetical protein
MEGYGTALGRLIWEDGVTLPEPRMGGLMHYVQCDDVTFMHNLFRELMARA